MFHKRIGHIVAIIMLLGVSAQPMTSFAGEPIAPAAIAEPEQSPQMKNETTMSLEGLTFDELRSETKEKLSETRQWVSNFVPDQDYTSPIKTMEIKIDRFQDSVEPAGRSFKASLRSKLRGFANIRIGNRTISAYGIGLILAFGLCLFLLTGSRATSRLGGRH